MVYLKTDPSPLMVRIRLSRPSSACLAGVSVARKYAGTFLLINALCQNWIGMRIFKEVLSRLEIVPIPVAQDLITFLIPKLPNTPGVLTNSRHISESPCIDDPTDILKKVFPKTRSRGLPLPFGLGHRRGANLLNNFHVLV